MRIEALYPRILGTDRIEPPEDERQELLALMRDYQGVGWRRAPWAPHSRFGVCEPTGVYFADYAQAQGQAELVRVTAQRCVRRLDQYLQAVYGWQRPTDCRVSSRIGSIVQSREANTSGVTPHHHTDNHFALAYYPHVDYGELPAFADIYRYGAFCAFDPLSSWRLRAIPLTHDGSWSQANSWVVMPETGTILIIPGNTLHHSAPFDGIERYLLTFFLEIHWADKPAMTVFDGEGS